MRPEHTQKFAYGIAALLGLFGFVAVALSNSLLPNFYHTVSKAEDLHNAVACSTANSADCTTQGSGVITDAYVSHSSKGGTHYHVNVADTNSNSVAASTAEVDINEYNEMPTGTPVHVTEWMNSIITVYAPDNVGYSTPDNPISQLVLDTFSLFVPIGGVAALVAAILLLGNTRTPDDIARESTRDHPTPPREITRGLLGSVMTWYTGRAALTYLSLMVLEAAYFGVRASNGDPNFEVPAPFVMGLTFILVSALVYGFYYRRMARIISEGVLAEIPVTGERMIRNRGRSIGAKVTYQLSDGRQGHLRITKPWWSKIHLATKLHVLTSPSTGKVQRVLGMTDDAGGAVY